MIEDLELRIVEDFADLLFRPDEGKKTESGIVRIVSISGDDPRCSKIGELQRQMDREYGRSFFHGWIIRRRYTKAELDNASLFQINVRFTFEPAGEQQGTTYDESMACPLCGAGARQITPLYLPEKRIPKSKDFSRTIANEIVVSQRVKELFARHGITGAAFLPVYSNRSSTAKSNEWFQLAVLDSSSQITKPTRIGINPFDDDKNGEYRCPLGDLLGLNLLSEVTITSTSRGDADIFCTRQFVGVRRGLLRPERIIFISPKLRSLIEAEKIKGLEIEVAHIE